MANDNDTETGKTQTSLRIDTNVLNAVVLLAGEEERSMANMIAVLLKTHPRIQPILEGQSAEVAA
jgi:hypothetical protein